MTDLDSVLFQLVTGPKSSVYPQSRSSGVIVPEAFNRVQTTWLLAVEVWGDEATAVEFLRRRHAMLHDRKPIDVALESDEGAKLVRDILGRLKYGTAA